MIPDTTPPILTIPGDLTLTFEQLFTSLYFSQATATDDNPHLTITAIEVITAQSSSREFIIERTWTARDRAGNTTTKIQIITVTDGLPTSIIGTPGDDTLTGTLGRDRINGLGGNDRMNGGGGDDLINGGSGNDLMNGGAGTDVIIGGAGNDTIQVAGTEAEFDLILGGANIDTVVNIGGTDLTVNTFNLAGDLEVLNGGGQAVRGNDEDNQFNFLGVTLINVTQVDGGNGNDTLTASNLTADVLYNGGAGNDVLAGQGFGDRLFGGAGDDFLSGGGGNDQLNGEAGIDIIVGGSGNDIIEVTGAEAEFDTLIGGVGTDTVVNIGPTSLTFNAFNGAADLERLEAGGQAILGNDNDNVFNFFGVVMIDVTQVDGGNGNDTLTASSVTNDVIYSGGAGDDVLIGQQRRDILLGGSGEDTIAGGGGEDTIAGGDGADVITGGQGNDGLTGGNGADIFRFEASLGNNGRDLITDFADGSDRLALIGFSVTDIAQLTIVQAGADTVITGIAGNLNYGQIRLLGFTASDLDNSDFIFTPMPSPPVGTAGNDTWVGTAGDDVIDGLAGEDRLYGLGGNDAIAGGDGDDLLDGGIGLDLLNGGAGIDVVNGGSGNDTIQVTGTEAEFDTLIGGVGTDTVINMGGSSLTFNAFNGAGDIERLEAAGQAVLGNAGDNLFNFVGVTLIGVAAVAGGNGQDLIWASNLTDDVIYGGDDGNDTLLGESRRDVLQGGQGDDRIDGGGGNDVLNGGIGLDVIYGGADNDTIQVAGAEAEFDLLLGGIGFDTVVNVGGTEIVFNTFNLAGDIERLEAGGQAVRGNANHNVFNFFGVRLIGVAQVAGGSGHDVITTASATDDVIYAGDDGNDQLIGQSRRDILWGGAGDDEMDGGAGNDTIDGGSGVDRITGGLGNDSLTGGSEGDTFRFLDSLGNNGLDQITDFATGLDRLEFVGFGISDRAQLNILQSGLDTVITGIAGNLNNGQIRLLNVTASNLTNADFIFTV